MNFRYVTIQWAVGNQNVHTLETQNITDTELRQQNS